MRYFKLQTKTIESREAGHLFPAEPRNWLEKMCACYLKGQGRYIGHSYWQEELERLPYEVEVDAAQILEMLREQLNWAHKLGLTPTKVVMGPETLEKITTDRRLRPYIGWARGQAAGIPLLSGLEVVVNPFLEGIAVL